MASQVIKFDLDSLIRQYTSFKGWADLQASLATGYVPSIIRPRKGDEQRLVRMLEARGVKVYTGK